MARIVMTGATGFVGGRVAERLRQRGDEVVALVRRVDADLDAVGVAQRVVELTDAEAITAVLEADGPVDGIVHAAATAGPDLEQVRTVNLGGTRAILTAARAAGTPRVVHVSTTSVYDRDAAGEASPDAVLDEGSPLVTARPDADPDPYSLTKAEADEEVLRAIDGGMSAQILRPPAVLGAGATSTWGTRVPSRYRDGELPPRPPATVFGYVHVDDLVDAILASLASDATETCNVVGGHTTMGDYLAALRRAVPAPPAVSGASPEPPWRGRYASERLGRTLGVEPTRTFDDAMAEIVTWWTEGHPDTT